MNRKTQPLPKWEWTPTEWVLIGVVVAASIVQVILTATGSAA